MTRVAVIGGGAAGMMAAAFAAAGGAETLLLEHTPDGGRKILISGGGRCNILPAHLDETRFVTDSSPHTLRNIVRSWPLHEQRAFFEQVLAQPLVEETESAKLFPASQRARDVRDGLLAHAVARGARWMPSTTVSGLMRAGSGWRIACKDERTLDADRVIVATGGLSVPKTGSDGRGLALLAELGHTIHEPYAALTPVNAERVLAGRKPRPKVRSLVSGLRPDQFHTIRLLPGEGELAVYRRVSRYRIGSKVKPRTYYVHQERRDVHSVGEVQLVFSTRKSPKQTGKVEVEKILMTNNLKLATRTIGELYTLRWQIELFFKELKSTLGMDQYRFRKFERVRGWVQMALITFLYLEWYRARQIACRDLPKKEKRWWERQRTHGLCQAIRQQAERAELQYIAERLQTQGGIRRLQRELEHACPAERRPAA